MADQPPLRIEIEKRMDASVPLGGDVGAESLRRNRAHSGPHAHACSRRNACSASEPSHQKMLSGSVNFATSRTQSSTAWFRPLFSPTPLGGEMAGAMFFIVLMSECGTGWAQ